MVGPLAREVPERGDIVLVPFPFTDLSTSKRRPVLALTAVDSYGDFIAMPVASRPQGEHGVSMVQSLFRHKPCGKEAASPRRAR